MSWHHEGSDFPLSNCQHADGRTIQSGSGHFLPHAKRIMNSGNEIGFRQLFDRDTWTYTYMLFDPKLLKESSLIP